MKAAVARVVEALRAAGVSANITEFAESTRTADEAARAVGASVGQIVKSLVFVAGERPILALVSGANRADVAKLAALAGAPIRQADAATVRAATGYAIGGVPPLGHATTLPTYLDADLRQYMHVWAAAGTPNAVFPLTPAELERITSARVVDLAVRADGQARYR
ncbi:MAG TPA: YbaK/EbsC family protein [Ktedonobacterales bacterium]